MDQASESGPYVGKRLSTGTFVVDDGVLADYYGGLELEPPSSGYHTDKEASRELGFQDVVVGGRRTMAYVGHILEERFGETWWRSGSFDLKFTNPVWPGDTITANGVVTGADPDDPARTAAFVWIAKADGTVALIARAGVAA